MTFETFLPLALLVAVAHSKAIVTNNCPNDVYVWSLPETGLHVANEPIKANGGQYSEYFHQGSPDGAGISVSVASEPLGIYSGGDMITLAYTVNSNPPSTVWVNVDPKGEWGHITFFTCAGPLKVTAPTAIRECSISDNIELVLCGNNRTSPEHDPTPQKQLAQCAMAQGLHERHDNKTQPRGAPMCLRRIVAPKQTNSTVTKAKAAAHVTKPRNGPIKQEKSQAPNNAKNQTTSPEDPSKVILAIEYVALGTDGTFKSSLSDVNPNLFAEKYARPLLRLVWLEACDISDEMDWDCDEFKAALKAAYPDIDKVQDQHQSHNGTVVHVDKSSAAVTKKDGKAQGDATKKKACDDLAALFHDMPHQTCDELVKSVKLKWAGKEVNLGALNRNGQLGDSSDLEEELERQWPEIEWSSDDE
jgi:hypothetical protein